MKPVPALLCMVHTLARHQLHHWRARGLQVRKTLVANIDCMHDLALSKQPHATAHIARCLRAGVGTRQAGVVPFHLL
jgi:hypothetical protein